MVIPYYGRVFSFHHQPVIIFAAKQADNALVDCVNPTIRNLIKRDDALFK